MASILEVYQWTDAPNHVGFVFHVDRDQARNLLADAFGHTRAHIFTERYTKAGPADRIITPQVWVDTFQPRHRYWSDVHKHAVAAGVLKETTE